MAAGPSCLRHYDALRTKIGMQLAPLQVMVRFVTCFFIVGFVKICQIIVRFE